MPEEQVSKTQSPVEPDSAESNADEGAIPTDPSSSLDQIDQDLAGPAESLEIDGGDDSSGSAKKASSGPAKPANHLSTPPLPDFAEMLTEATAGSIELLKDVELNVKIELGRAEMSVENILKLGNGSVVELNKLAGDPVDVLVNDQLVARGEVLVLNDNFCVRINEIVHGMTEKLAHQ